MIGINFHQLLQDFQDSSAFWVLAVAAVITTYSHFEKTRLGNFICDGATLLRLDIKKQFKRMDKLISFNAADKKVRRKAKPDKFGGWFDIFIGTSFAMCFYSMGFTLLIALCISLRMDMTLLLFLFVLPATFSLFWCGGVYQGLANKAAKENGINLKPWQHILERN